MRKGLVSQISIQIGFKEDRWKVREYLFNREKLYCCNIITFNTVKMEKLDQNIERYLGMTHKKHKHCQILFRNLRINMNL